MSLVYDIEGRDRELSIFEVAMRSLRYPQRDLMDGLKIQVQYECHVEIIQWFSEVRSLNRSR